MRLCCRCEFSQNNPSLKREEIECRKYYLFLFNLFMVNFRIVWATHLDAVTTLTLSDSVYHYMENHLQHIENYVILAFWFYQVK